jgi:integrase/recombinase XerD
VLVDAETSKSDRDRVVPFWSATLEALRAWLDVRPAQAVALFTAYDGWNMKVDRLRYYGLHQIMRRRVREAGVPRKKALCHIWRHTFARMYVCRGGDLETLRRLLGHKSLETVRIYLAFRTDELERRHFELSPVRQIMEGGALPDV